jgi:hypothetical protein
MTFIRRIVVPVWNWIVGLFRLGQRLFNQYIIAPIKQTVIYMNTAAQFEAVQTMFKLRNSSPVATGLLANSWRVIPTVTRSADGIPNVRVQITNTAPNSWFRIVGRAPGRMPPTEAIRQWCKVKGIDPVFAFPIARNIGKQGTFRWRTQSNVLNYIRTTATYGIPNPWTETIARIQNQLTI